MFVQNLHFLFTLVLLPADLIATTKKHLPFDCFVNMDINMNFVKNEIRLVINTRCKQVKSVTIIHILTINKLHHETLIISFEHLM